MKLLIEKSMDPFHNLAMEETLLEQADGETVYLWRNRPSVIVGRHQNTAAEVDRAYAAENGISVVRRLTGGGAVYHDLGNMNMSFLYTGGDFEARAAKGVRQMTDFLASEGIEAVLTGRNDLCVKGGDGALLKIAGTAQTLKQDRGIFHGCLLFDTDRSVMERVLTPPADKLRSKGIASVRNRTVNLREASENLRQVTADGFFQRMCEYFKGLCRETAATPALEAAAQALMEDRYLAWAWNYGRDPAGNVENVRRFPIGRVELELDIRGGRIRDCRFRGDYLTYFDLAHLADALRGQPFDEVHMGKALDAFDLEHIFQVTDRREVTDFLSGRSNHA